METRSRKKKAALEKNNDSNNEYLLKRQNKEDRLRSLLGPFDKYISSLESILVWDYPIVFIILLVFINLLFCLYTITPFYCLLSFCLFVCLCVQFFCNHLWPLVNDSEDSLDGWVKLQVTSEDQFDLVRSTANLLTRLDTVYATCEQVKRNNPQKFNVVGFIVFFLTLIVCLFVNDFYFVYFSVMLLVCWPGMKHNHLPERFYNIIKPHLNSLEKALHIRKTVNKRKLRQKLGKKPSNKKNKKKKGEIRLDELVLTEDDSDMDLQQFLPGNHDDHHHDKHHYNNQLFPVFPSPMRPGVVDDDDDDDDDTTGEYLPHVTTLSDSRENTDDDEFMPHLGKFALNDLSLEPTQLSSQDEGRKEDGEGGVKKRMNKSGRKGVDGGKGKNGGGRNDGGGSGGKDGSGIKSGDDGAVTEEMFAEGLSFDDADDIDSIPQPIIPALPITHALLIGGLLGQAQTGSNDADQSEKTSGFFGKALGGFNFLKKAVTSVYAPSSVEGGEGETVVDNEFDFLKQEDLDEEEDF